MKIRRVALLALLLCTHWGCGQAPAAATLPVTVAERVVVPRHGSFERRVLATGELVAAEAVSLVVPETTNWQVELRWLAPDGTYLPAGARAAELDNAAIVDQLEEKEIALDQSLIELEGKVAAQAVTLAEKSFALEQKQTELAKAELEADVPESLISRRELQEKTLAVAKARFDLAKAQEDLRSSEQAGAADLDVLRVDIEKARREIRAAHEALAALELTTPVAGVWVVGLHPWEGRKIQIGDSVFVGMSLGTVPNLRSVIVEARLADVDDGAVAPGMPAEVKLDAYPGRTFQGRVRDVTGIAQELEPETTRRFFKMIVEIDEVDTERMIPGMSARVEVISERRDGVVLVPRWALERSADGAFVVIDGQPKPVVAGHCSELDCVIESGLDVAAGAVP
ncbi:MAG: efflux RND transporter periplasmic adaptor subunit [Thermoanaerobaculia bacterium]|nr:efflux RND transporter periplasmic adaptor subunit [Thermoanaerobaculia bacterium]